jgi:hypothetical protein
MTMTSDERKIGERLIHSQASEAEIESESAELVEMGKRFIAAWQAAESGGVAPSSAVKK